MAGWLRSDGPFLLFLTEEIPLKFGPPGPLDQPSPAFLKLSYFFVINFQIN